jgi:hypothetical protein
MLAGSLTELTAGPGAPETGMLANDAVFRGMGGSSSVKSDKLSLLSVNPPARRTADSLFERPEVAALPS